MAGILTPEQCGKVFQAIGRCGSSHYGIGSDGRIGQYVDEINTAWTNSNWNSNCKSVTIEVSNCEIGGQWRVSDQALHSLIELMADIAIRNNLGKLVKGKNVVWHRMFCATTCPGDYILSKLDYIIAEANKIIEGGQSAPVAPTKKVDVIYQAYINNTWLSNVKNCNNTADGYAGIYGKPISSFRGNTTEGKLKYKVHTLNGKWLDEVTNREKDRNGDDYAGIYGRYIDAIMFIYPRVRYRVHLINGGWLPWVTGYNEGDSINGYAGNLGHAIDGIQVQID